MGESEVIINDLPSISLSLPVYVNGILLYGIIYLGVIEYSPTVLA